ncbi:MAG: MOSC domain-containing protein [Myxococcota bacterium]
MGNPTKAELISAPPGSVDTQALRFEGLRGDPSRHLDRAELLRRLDALPAAPRDEGTLDRLLARGPDGSRKPLNSAMLTVEGGLPGDRWADSPKYGPDYQLATIRTDYARVVANGQDLALHGDNLFVSLDLSADNLPIGSQLALGDARLEVTPVAHNGCKKWVQRFGLAAMQLHLEAAMRPRNLRGIYLRVVVEGEVKVGDGVRVLRRGFGPTGEIG